MIRTCNGCGVRLQTESRNKTGYIPIDKYEKSKFCMRCFRLTNYNELSKVELNINNEEILSIVNKKSELSFFLVDFLNINSETMKTFNNILTKKVLVISKLDIVPRSVKKESLKNWLIEEYNIMSEIIFLSAKTNYGITSIINCMDQMEVTKAYLLGYTNAGKSTLINKINEKYNGKNGSITTSLLPNTTLGFIKIPVEELVLMDSPGFVQRNTFVDINNNDLIKKINSKTTIKPVTYQMKGEMSIVVEEKIRIESKDINSWTFYMSNEIKLDKIYSKNNKLKEVNLLDLNLDDNTDIVIKGLGFINVKQASSVNIYVEDKNLIEVRKSCF